MAARVQIVVEAKDASSGVLRAITGQLGALGGLVEELTSKNVSWGNVAERAATMVIDGMKESVRATVEYAEQVRSLQMISGESAEETSRFIQVLDDYKISAADALVATRSMTKEGLTPNLETLARLSDEYLSINDAQERNEFILKNLGRSGLQWVEVLNKGSAALLEQGAAIDQSLVLTQKAVDDARRYEIAIDNWNDSVQALKVSLGTDLLPVLTDLTSGMTASQRAMEILEEQGIKGANVWSMEYTEALKQAKEEQKAATEEMLKNADAVERDTRAIDELAQVADNLKAALSGEFLEAHESYDEKMFELREEAVDLNEQLMKLQKEGVKKNADEIENLTEKLTGNKKAQDELGKATDKTIAKMIYQQVAASLDAKGQLELARQLGLVSEQDYAIATAIDDLTAKYDTNQDGVINNTEATNDYISALARLNGFLNTLPETVTTTVITNFVQTGTPSTGSGNTPLDLCFIGNTYVRMSDGSERAIQDITENDAVMAYDFKRCKAVEARVEKVFWHMPGEMSGGYYLLINDSIGATPEHPFYANGIWVKAGDLRMGDELRGFDGKPVYITRIRKVYRRVRTYNLQVARHHNYFVNGVLVHNKNQQGGQVYAGVPTMVGEGGAEPLFPSMGGRVLSHTEAIHAQTVGAGIGGNTNYFYGNVTIASGGDNAGDIMEIR